MFASIKKIFDDRRGRKEREEADRVALVVQQAVEQKRRQAREAAEERKKQEVIDSLRNGESITYGDKLTAENINVKLKRGEVLLAKFVGDINKAKTTSRWKARSGGVSVTLIKGVRVRVGQTDGQMVTREEIAPLGMGDIIVTNQRMLFTGIHVPVSIKYENLISYKVDDNELRIATEKASYVVQFSSGYDGRVVDALLDYNVPKCSEE